MISWRVAKIFSFTERQLSIIQCGALFLTIAGFRWWLIGRFGVDIPQWDQWDGEWEPMYLPYFNGSLSIGDWFVAHNEHRILFTRILTLILLHVNGQWDPNLQMVVNVLPYAAFACWLFFAFAGAGGALFQFFLATVLATIFTLPFGFENTLGGFQSPFYFLAGFSLVAIWLLINAPPFSGRWLTGLLFAAAALFTMASGIFAAIAVLMFFTVLCFRERDSAIFLLKANRPTLAVCVALIAIGALLAVKVEAHAQYQAKGMVEFVTALTRCLAWPWTNSPWLGVTIWIPYLVFISKFTARKLPDEKCERLLIAMGGWVLLQVAAMAFARAAIINSSRYADLLSFGLLVNVLCAVLLVIGILPGSRRKAWLTLFSLWLLLNGSGLYVLSFNGKLTETTTYNLTQLFRTAQFVGTGNFKALIDPYVGGGYAIADAHQLSGYLADPRLRQILPAGLRAPLDFKPRNGFTQAVYLPEFDLKIATPYPWEKVWNFQGEYGFSGTVQKTGNLPFIRFFVSGATEALSVVDDSNHGRSVFSLPPRSDPAWRQVYAFCPGNSCLISGLEGSGPLAVSAVKEVGALSLLALVASSYGGYVAGAGLGLAVSSFALAFLVRKRAE
jgi:hypothetical protein